MNLRIGVVDYGLGNLFSIQRALRHLEAEPLVSCRPEELNRCQGLVLPGVGAFGDGMEQLRARGLISFLKEWPKTGKPLLGICLGMQLLFSESEEFGRHEGLNLIPGSVRRLRGADPAGRLVKIPHVGWSGLERPPHLSHWQGTVLEDAEQGDAMYFVHSYVPFPDEESMVVATMRYGEYPYCALVEQGTLIGCQFHPEKSAETGQALLRHFLKRVADPSERLKEA